MRIRAPMTPQDHSLQGDWPCPQAFPLFLQTARLGGADALITLDPQEAGAPAHMDVSKVRLGTDGFFDRPHRLIGCLCVGPSNNRTVLFGRFVRVHRHPGMPLSPV